jgi:hypothetical protein
MMFDVRHDEGMKRREKKRKGEREYLFTLLMASAHALSLALLTFLSCFLAHSYPAYAFSFATALHSHCSFTRTLSRLLTCAARTVRFSFPNAPHVHFFRSLICRSHALRSHTRQANALFALSRVRSSFCSHTTLCIPSLTCHAYSFCLLMCHAYAFCSLLPTLSPRVLPFRLLTCHTYALFAYSLATHTPSSLTHVPCVRSLRLLTCHAYALFAYSRAAARTLFVHSRAKRTLSSLTHLPFARSSLTHAPRKRSLCSLTCHAYALRLLTYHAYAIVCSRATHTRKFCSLTYALCSLMCRAYALCLLTCHAYALFAYSRATRTLSARFLHFRDVLTSNRSLLNHCSLPRSRSLVRSHLTCTLYARSCATRTLFSLSLLIAIALSSLTHYSLPRVCSSLTHNLRPRVRTN